MVSSYALRPAFTPLTIVLMVIGFIVAWPLGLLMLAYILWGERIPEIRRHFDSVKRDWSSDTGCGRVDSGGIHRGCSGRNTILDGLSASCDAARTGVPARQSAAVMAHPTTAQATRTREMPGVGGSESIRRMR